MAISNSKFMRPILFIAQEAGSTRNRGADVRVVHRAADPQDARSIMNRDADARDPDPPGMRSHPGHGIPTGGKCVYGKIQIVRPVKRGNLRPDSCLAFRNDRIEEPYRIDTPFV
jgi:hypothetical protein